MAISTFLLAVKILILVHFYSYGLLTAYQKTRRKMLSCAQGRALTETFFGHDMYVAIYMLRLFMSVPTVAFIE